MFGLVMIKESELTDPRKSLPPLSPNNQNQTPKQNRMAEFNVKLEGIKLSKEATARIQSGIQQLVLNELAGTDTKGDLVLTRPIKIGPIINGIVARIDANKILVQGLNK